jgi:hypothetical protein
MDNIKNLISNIHNDDKLASGDWFNSVMNDKIADAFGAQMPTVATTMMKKEPEQTQEKE